jgi:hypothetical protein
MMFVAVNLSWAWKTHSSCKPGFLQYFSLRSMRLTSASTGWFVSFTYRSYRLTFKQWNGIQVKFPQIAFQTLMTCRLSPYLLLQMTHISPQRMQRYD